jgi:hypothetical protein
MNNDGLLAHMAQFICHCTDDRKITSSVHASNFVIVRSDQVLTPQHCGASLIIQYFIQTDTTFKHTQGEDNLTKYERKSGIASGDQMDSYFCKICGSLMYRISSGFSGMRIMRLGSVDDFALLEGPLRPRLEQFGKDRVSWSHPGAEACPEKCFEENIIKPGVNPADYPPIA